MDPKVIEAARKIQTYLRETPVDMACLKDPHDLRLIRLVVDAVLAQAPKPLVDCDPQEVRAMREFFLQAPELRAGLERAVIEIRQQDDA